MSETFGLFKTFPNVKFLQGLSLLPEVITYGLSRNILGVRVAAAETQIGLHAFPEYNTFFVRAWP